MSEKATILIPFAPGAAEGDLKIILDPDKHTSMPASTEDVYVRAITDQVLISKGTTGGTIRTDNPSLTFEHEETLVFYNAQAATLEYPASTVLSKQWIGQGLGAVTITDRAVRAAQKGYGLLKVKYRVAYARLKITGTANLEGIIVWAADAAGREGSLQIGFADMAAEAFEPVIVEVRNYCTDLPVAGATVKVAGQSKGSTDQWGQVAAGSYKRGSIQTLEIAASGFKPSGTDALANDYFQVI
jgi:hypothetical protein